MRGFAAAVVLLILGAMGANMMWGYQTRPMRRVTSAANRAPRRKTNAGKRGAIHAAIGGRETQLTRSAFQCEARPWWFPKGIKRERGARAEARHAPGAPATVSGESPAN